jgi:hypothetical protein
MEELFNKHPARLKDNLGVSREGVLCIKGLLIRKAGLASTRHMISVHSQTRAKYPQI